MGKIIKFSFYLVVIFLFALSLPACKTHDKLENDNKKVMINDVNYSSLTEAISNALCSSFSSFSERIPGLQETKRGEPLCARAKSHSRFNFQSMAPVMPTQSASDIKKERF